MEHSNYFSSFVNSFPIIHTMVYYNYYIMGFSEKNGVNHVPCVKHKRRAYINNASHQWTFTDMIFCDSCKSVYQTIQYIDARIPTSRSFFHSPSFFWSCLLSGNIPSLRNV